MTGYRQHGVDPNAYDQPGPPLKPYNWVQWTGVAVGCVGVLLVTLDLLGRVGLIPHWVDAPPTTFVLLFLGVMLINSRRAPSTPMAEEMRARSRKTLAITAAICAVILGAAAVIEFQGA